MNVHFNPEIEALCSSGEQTDRYYTILPKPSNAPYRTVCLCSRPAGWRREEHMHPWWQVIVVLSGSVCISCGGETAVLRRGMVSILPPGVAHTIWAEADYSQFGPEIFDLPDDPLVRLLRENILYPTEFECKEVLGLCEETSGLFPENDSISRAIICAQTNVIMLRMLKKLAAEQTSQFQRSLEKYLEMNLSVNVSMEQVAAHMHMSSSHCERLCRRYYNCGVMTLHRRMRAKLACELLSMTTIPVGEIGHRVGFTDAAHFSKFFKNMMGVSPSTFRISGS